MRLFKAAVVEQVLTRLTVPEDRAIESKMSAARPVARRRSSSRTSRSARTS